MLFILFYYIICDTYTFENKEELTQAMVKEAMKKAITDVLIKNISIIGNQAFYGYSKLESVSFQEPIILTTIG